MLGLSFLGMPALVSQLCFILVDRGVLFQTMNVCSGLIIFLLPGYFDGRGLSRIPSASTIK